VDTASDGRICLSAIVDVGLSIRIRGGHHGRRNAPSTRRCLLHHTLTAPGQGQASQARTTKHEMLFWALVFPRAVWWRRRPAGGDVVCVKRKEGEQANVWREEARSSDRQRPRESRGEKGAGLGDVRLGGFGRRKGSKRCEIRVTWLVCCGRLCKPLVGHTLGHRARKPID
jgi:hypothetical protein